MKENWKPRMGGLSSFSPLSRQRNRSQWARPGKDFFAKEKEGKYDDRLGVPHIADLIGGVPLRGMKLASEPTQSRFQTQKRGKGEKRKDRLARLNDTDNRYTI